MISQTALEWLASRGISQATLEQVPVASGTTYFPDLGSRLEAIFFRYREGWKARSYPEKSFVAGGGFKATFWGLDEVLEANPDMVMITEGEMDRLSLIEAGIPSYQVLSVPTGASGDHAYAHNALQDGLGRAKRFIWCGDGDEAGKALQKTFVGILGTARFYHVTWPEGIKDANEMLLADGQEVLRELILEGALPWPQSGLFRLSELRDPPAMTLWEPDIPALSGRVRLAPRTLSLVTGQPGHGKTMFFSQLWFEIIQKYNLTACVATFETQPKPHLRRQLRTLLTGKLEVEMEEREKAHADAWINERYLFLVHPEQQPNLDWFLECAETAVVRHGAKIIQLDPWNRLEAMRNPRESETDYILRCLRALYVFAKDMDCHMQVVAHPAKMDGPRRNSPPALEDVAGSKHWENIVDQGFVVHRPQMYDGAERKTEIDFYHRKARYEELGYPCKLLLNYDLNKRKYVPLADGLIAPDI